MGEEHGGENIKLTPEQEKVIETVLRELDRSKEGLMKCLICNEQTHERGLVCTGPSPSVPIIIGLCYPCKNLPHYDEEIQRRIREYLISIKREDLL